MHSGFLQHTHAPLTVSSSHASRRFAMATTLRTASTRPPRR